MSKTHVARCPFMPQNERQLERWLDQLPGRLVNVCWAGGGALAGYFMAVTVEEDPVPSA